MRRKCNEIKVKGPICLFVYTTSYFAVGHTIFSSEVWSRFLVLSCPSCTKALAKPSNRSLFWKTFAPHIPFIQITIKKTILCNMQKKLCLIKHLLKWLEYDGDDLSSSERCNGIPAIVLRLRPLSTRWDCQCRERWNYSHWSLTWPKTSTFLGLVHVISKAQ